MKVLVSDPLSDKGMEILKKEKELQVDVKTDLKPEQLKEIIKDYDALIVRSATKVTKDVIERALKLKVIGRAGVGLDNVDLEAATKRGIIVMNTPGGNTISTCEHTFSLLLAMSRNIAQANASMKQGLWQRSKFMGVEVYGKTLGIIGLGRIGREVAKRAQSFGMKIIVYDPFISEELAKQLEVALVDLEKLYKESDYITVHVPITDETKCMISEKEFSLMKKGVRIINCARGGIIDEKALAKAIEEGKVAASALDVFEAEPPKDLPFLKFDNVILTPHLGASTEEAQVNVAVEIAEVVKNALLGRGICNAANYPCLDAEAFKVLEPYINLCEKLGLLVSQIGEGRIKKINVIYSGQIIQHDTTPLTLALMKGLLFPVLQDSVNFINSLTLAKERNVEIEEIKSTKEEEFANQVVVEVTTDKEKRSVTGTLSSNKQARIVKVDQFYVEATPLGVMILLYNLDKPGIIGNLGTLLGKYKINIAGMTFGREKQGGKAISLLNVDSPISSELLGEIKKLENILAVKVIKL